MLCENTFFWPLFNALPQDVRKGGLPPYVLQCDLFGEAHNHKAVILVKLGMIVVLSASKRLVQH